MKFFIVQIILLALASATQAKVSKKEILAAWDNITEVYSHEISEKGFQFKVVFTDKSDTGVASINPRLGPTLYIANRLLKLKPLNQNHMYKVLCHELGHVLGGAPYIEVNLDDSSEMSTEGQADYFAASKCLKRIFANQIENEKYVTSQISSSQLKRIKKWDCLSAQCQRIAHVSYQVFKILSPKQFVSLRRIVLPEVELTRLEMYHPSSQCRLETMIRGALCPIPAHIPFAPYNQAKGSCHRDQIEESHIHGARPRCWFNPFDLYSYY